MGQKGSGTPGCFPSWSRAPGLLSCPASRSSSPRGVLGRLSPSCAVQKTGVHRCHGIKHRKALFLLLQTFLKNADVPYWIGLQKGSFPWYDYGWLEEEDPDSEGTSEAWFWVDGSLYERYVAALPLAKTPLLCMAVGSILNPTSTQFQAQAPGNKEHQSSRD